MFIAVAIISGLCLLAFGVYASANIASGVYVKALCRVPATEKVVALTFDDGPDPEHTPEVLEVLRRHGVEAAFFCIGHRAERHSEIVRQIVAAGHIVGSHSHGHTPLFALGSVKKTTGDMLRCNETLESIAGGKIIYFRPPYGVTNPSVAAAARKLGLTTVGWSVRSFDTMGGPVEKTVERMLRKVRPGTIVLLHDNLRQSALLLDELIGGLKNKGYQIKRFDRI